MPIRDPSERLTRTGRFAQMLQQQAQAAPPVESHAQGLAQMLRQGLSGWMMGADANDRKEAMTAFDDAISKGGDVKGMMTAMEGVGGEYGQSIRRDLAGQLMQQRAATTRRTEQRGYDEDQAVLAHQRALEQKGAPGWAKPVIPRPGRDVPYSSAVAAQLTDIAGAKAAAVRPEFVSVPGKPGLQQNIKTGEVKTLPLTPQEELAGKVGAKSALVQAEALRDLPQIEQSAEYTKTLIDELISHPGMKGVVGAPESISGAVYKVFGTPVSGTDEAGFVARLDQIGGRQFLEAFESLKGGGQITEIEGKKATEAMSRLTQTGQSEREYIGAARDLQEVMDVGIRRARRAAGVSPYAPSKQPATSQQPAPKAGGWSIKRKPQ